MNSKRPKISVFTTCKNGGRFLRETLDSIFNQTFEDFEIVLVDGASTDNTIDILKEYEKDTRLRWISEPCDCNEGFYKALMMTRGEYVMCMPVSDSYASKTWFQKCVYVLDNDNEVSLVYGLPQEMAEDGSLNRVVYSEFFNHPPPQKTSFLDFWLATFFIYPELNYCVRAEVYKNVFPNIYIYSNDFSDQNAPFTKCNYNFNVSGYLPYFLPIVGCYGRIHSDSRNSTCGVAINKRADAQYWSAIINYRKDILSGKIKHVFRDGKSNVIRKIEPHELKAIRLNVLYYRMTRKHYLAYVDKLNLNYWKAKFSLIRKVKKITLRIVKKLF